MAATAALIAVGGVAGASAASTADDVTIAAIDPGSTWSDPLVEIETGDTVTWTFGPPANLPHNIAATDNGELDDDDPTWASYLKPGPGQFDPMPPAETAEYRFTRAGTYTYVCKFHPDTMSGTIVVTGPPVDPTPTPTPTATPTPIPQPSDPRDTPPPSGGSDTVKPSISKVRLKARRKLVRVRFELSEPATVTIRAKRGKKVLVKRQVQAPAGRSMVKLRSRKLKKGRVVVQLRARDALGNRSGWARKKIRIGR